MATHQSEEIVFTRQLWQFIVLSRNLQVFVIPWTIACIVM